MAKRSRKKVSPFPTRYLSRYFGDYNINAANGWEHDITRYVADCAPPEEGIVFGALDLPDWPDGTPVFPLIIYTPPRKRKKSR